MNRTMRTADELVQIYVDAHRGVPPKEIARKTGFNYYSVLTALQTLDKYLTGKARTQRRHATTYQEAMKRIRKQQAASEAQAVPDPTPKAQHPPDSFSALKSSFDSFQQAIAYFIESELKRRYRALQEENQALHEENRQLHEKVAKGQTINWIETLEDRLSEEHA